MRFFVTTPEPKCAASAVSGAKLLAPYEQKHRELRIKRGTNSVSISLNIGAAMTIRGITVKGMPEGLEETTQFYLRNIFSLEDAVRFFPTMELRTHPLSREFITACILKGERSTRQNSEARMEPRSTDDPNTLRVEVSRLWHKEGIVYFRILPLSGMWVGYEEGVFLLDNQDANRGGH